MVGWGWQIDVPGVQGVLTQVNGSAGTLGTALQPAAAAFEALAGGCCGEFAASIAASGGELLQSRQWQLTQITNAINSALGGAAAATQEYINGDEQMAANLQAQASQTAVNGDFSLFNSILGTGGGQ